MIIRETALKIITEELEKSDSILGSDREGLKEAQ